MTALTASLRSSTLRLIVVLALLAVGLVVAAPVSANASSSAAPTAASGEPDFGPLTRAVIGAGEGAFFGFGLALGLTRRPSTRR